MPQTFPDDVPITAAPDGVRVAVRLTPRGRADRLEGIARRADDAVVLKVSVTAPPAQQRANDALLRLLAKEWGVPRRDLAIIVGQKSRSKIVHVAGDPAALLAKLVVHLTEAGRN